MLDNTHIKNKQVWIASNSTASHDGDSSPKRKTWAFSEYCRPVYLQRYIYIYTYVYAYYIDTHICIYIRIYV